MKTRIYAQTVQPMGVEPKTVTLEIHAPDPIPEEEYEIFIKMFPHNLKNYVFHSNAEGSLGNTDDDGGITIDIMMEAEGADQAKEAILNAVRDTIEEENLGDWYYELTISSEFYKMDRQVYSINPDAPFDA